MNKNRGLTPLAVVLMLSGSLALTGCDDKQAQQGGQQMPAVGVVTVKTEPLQITTELPGRTSAYRIAEVRPQVRWMVRPQVMCACYVWSSTWYATQKPINQDGR